MSDARGEILVIGIGNVLLRDDGVGVRVVDALGRLAERDPGLLPPGTRLLDGGTLGLGLLAHFEGARAVLIVDAVDRGQAPGTVSVLRGAAVAEAGSRTGGMNPGGLAGLLATASLLGVLPAAVTVLGIEVAEIGVGLALSREIDAVLPAALDAARRELHALDAIAAARGPGRAVLTSKLAGTMA